MKQTINLSNGSKALIAVTLLSLGVLGRLLPHAWDFAPIVAIGLFAGARLGSRYAFSLPVAAMLISDAFIGFYDWRINLTVYAAMALSGAVGLLLRRTKNPLAVAAGSASASSLFFLVTNGAVWAFGSMYAPGLGGLMASYAAGIPFFRNALVGDLWYSLAIFGAYELAVAAFRSFRRPSAQGVEALPIDIS